ncbi:repeat set, removed [Histoplasma capsulatum G186AR]|uniref:Repeat set, removed n=1 Tax=Ajellomyces capsulatus TaxID=5037 RepID=A0A8H7YVI1_AJECA|nr:repeat set, removed [Histoplasma capsulatum]QSS68059.1 repeat set, removed [Histoplasma capsulatum G186AR]
MSGLTFSDGMGYTAIQSQSAFPPLPLCPGIVQFHSKRHNIVKRWDACLSPTEDQLVECEFQLVAVETKGSDGGYDSSSLRLATWLATGLRNMRLRQRLPEVQTVQGNGKNKLRPFAHIAAVGRMWGLRVASKGGRSVAHYYVGRFC